MTGIHRTSSDGFVRPEVYERGRPDYPPGVVDALQITERTRVIDLGCGTGKLTRLIARADVIGVEPLETMRDGFTARDVPLVGGAAEALPFADESVDLVVCASAFHWFDHARAIPEIHRVLRPDGALGIIWNRRDKLDGWASEFWQITEKHRGDTPGYRTGHWRDALEASPLFGEIEEHWFDHTQRIDREGLLARIASISFIETLPDDVRVGVLAESMRFIDTHPETRDRASFALPYNTVVYRLTRT